MGKTRDAKNPSSWWFYFTKVGPNAARCNECNKEINQGSTHSTNSLKYHLKKHTKLFEQKKKAKNEENKAKLAKEKAQAKPDLNKLFGAGTIKNPNSLKRPLSISQSSAQIIDVDVPSTSTCREGEIEEFQDLNKKPRPSSALASNSTLHKPIAISISYISD
jgi:hypothetical protein